VPDSELIDRLVTDLRPVRRRSVQVDTVIVVALCVVELAVFLGLGAARPDMPLALTRPSFWWKLGSLGLISLVGAIVAILSFDPVRPPRRGLRWLAIIVALCLAAGWLIGLSREGVAGLADRLKWQAGVLCVCPIVALSLSPLLGLGLPMRRGAATDTGGTALAVGITAAAWGAFVFVFACPPDDPLYIAVWYAVGCGLVTSVVRLLLPPLTHW
jgi:hypothetical protein